MGIVAKCKSRYDYEQLPARLAMPPPLLTILLEMRDDRRRQDETLSRRADRINHHAAIAF